MKLNTLKIPAKRTQLTRVNTDEKNASSAGGVRGDTTDTGALRAFWRFGLTINNHLLRAEIIVG